MRKLYLLAIGSFLFSYTSYSQCTISGETTPTCENGAIQNLTTTGDFLLGPGLSGNNFDPSAANIGSNVINAYSTELGYTYTVDQTGTFAPVASTGTAVTLSDDDVSAALPVGFSFTFFGNTYTDFYISSNGFISFDGAVSSGCCSGSTIPANDAVNNAISWHWNDLYPPGSGSVSYETVGTAPNRRLLVNFDNQSHCCNSNGGNTAQIILYETTNVIEIHTTSATNDGSTGTQGIENANGTVAYATPGRNSATWTATNDYVAFIPDMNYVVDTLGAYAPVASTGTSVTLTDDDVSNALPVGFDFVFFGATYSDFYISSNGFISFDGTTSSGCCSGGTIPSADAVDNAISWHWNDLYPPGSGSISYETIGTAPNRQLLVTFTDQSHCCNSDGGNTAQIILNETTNIVEIHTTNATNDGSTGTQGIENATGTSGYTTPGRNSTNWSDSVDYVAFIPGDVCTSLTIDVNAGSTGTDVQNACVSYTWIDGNTYTSSNNSATYNIVGGAANGCDSLVTLDLTLDTVDVSVTNNSPTLESTATNATYQWIDCDNGDQPISGETNATFTAQSNGNYAVIVTQNGCTDTSACETVANIGLDDLDANTEVKVAPNPGVGNYEVSSSVMINKITVYDNTGKVVKTIDVDDLEGVVDITKASKGAYIFKIETQKGVITKNIIKQ